MHLRSDFLRWYVIVDAGVLLLQLRAENLCIEYRFVVPHRVPSNLTDIFPLFFSVSFQVSEWWTGSYPIMALKWKVLLR